MPLGVLYAVSNLAFVILYYVVGYRKSVVEHNLRNSFPNKGTAEIRRVSRQFYRHLCDLLVENVKLFSMSKRELMKRFKILNTEILDKYYLQDRSVILVGGHYNNWEIAAKGFDLYSPHQAVGIYSPLRDKFFERKLNDSRTRFGVEIVPKGAVPRAFVANKDRLTMTIFGADQSPTYNKQVHWTQFLSQETAVHLGTEVFAKKYNYPVVFIEIRKVRRGYYEGVLEVLDENPGTSVKGEITEMHTNKLEKVIEENPQYWLWSHKRWKRKRTAEEPMFAPVESMELA